MAFIYPRRGVFIGSITESFVISTATGVIYAYKFLHVADDLIVEVMLHTRDKAIEDEYTSQMLETPGIIRLWPQKAKVTIATDGLAFEVFEIELLD